MVGAVGSHLLAGDPALMPLPALVLLTLLASVAYARRHELLQPNSQAKMHRAWRTTWRWRMELGDSDGNVGSHAEFRWNKTGTSPIILT